MLNFLSNRGNKEGGMKYHKICNVFSSGQEKNDTHRHRKMWQNVHQ